MDHTLLILAIGPGVALMYYFWLRDRYEPEPRGKILKVMFWGALSVISAIMLEMWGESIFPTPKGDQPSHIDLFLHTFVLIAGAEELGKFLAVYLFIYRDAEFDEPYDGVVYCVAASLGFAIVENVLYVFRGGFAVGVMRAMLSVPGHALFGVAMGYFVGQAKFAKTRGREMALLASGFLVAVAMHGAYDYVLFSGRPLLILTVLPMMVMFWVFGLYLVRKGVAQSPFKAAHAARAQQQAYVPPPMEMSATMPAPSGVCPRCHTQVGVPDARFCGRCGAPLG